MASPFVSALATQLQLTENEKNILAAADVKSPEDVDSLVRAFPSIARFGLRVPLISDAVARSLKPSYIEMAQRLARQRPTVGMGAMPPMNARFPSGTSIGMPPNVPPLTPPVGSGPSAPIDLRPAHSWPVRNQGDRGTCVAFGSTACVEYHHFPLGTVPDYSEQFLYWAIKDHSADLRKHKDGTRLCYARDMLVSDGICDEASWQYDPKIVNPVSGQTAADPSRATKIAAAGRKLSTRTYVENPRSAAREVLRLLQAGHVVAVSLTVVKDPSDPNLPNNWNTPNAWAYGRVLSPPPSSIVVDGGHCVCLTGFVPDPTEPKGLGYFIVRNSWGTDWALNVPFPAQSLSPEQGYGEISAYYLDTYCWELYTC